MMEGMVVAVCSMLQTTPPRWLSLAEGFGVEVLTREPVPNEWSALACLQHLVDAERWVFPVRVQALLAGRDFPAFDPDSQGTRPVVQAAMRELAVEFAQLRAESVRLLAQVAPGDLVRQARHQELGVVSLGELLHEWVAHDLMHTVQAERALMQPFIQGCGPWRAYFRDHDVADR